MKPNMIKKIEDNLKLKITRGVVNRLLETLIFVLHDKWGWGDIRIGRLIEQVNEVYDAIESGYINFDDIIKANADIPKTIYKDE